MFKKLSFYLVAVIFNATLLGNSLPNREMIILLETYNNETLNKTLEAPNIYRYGEIVHPVGIGAISVSLLVALYQQAAPIIANKSLIKNIIDHQNLFFDFINLDRKTLHQKYYKYNRFRGRMAFDIFRKNCQRTSNLTLEANKMLSNLIKDGNNNFDQILDHISKHPKLQGDSYPEIRDAITNASYINSINLEMKILFLCSSIDFYTNWDIKQVNSDIFLLIPKNYIKNLDINVHTETAVPQNKIAKYTNLELELGLKIDHMKTIKRDFFDEQPIQSCTREISIPKSLEQIFLTVDDIKTAHYHKLLKHTWSIHMSGHGEPQNIQFNVLPQLYELKNLYTSKLGTGKTLIYEENISKHIKNQNLISKHNQKYVAKIKKLDQEIKKIEERKRLNNKLDQAMINSLSINEFRDILKFFNDKIETAFLYYFSCFSAGQHLVEPYQEKGKSLILKYTVMTGTLSENESLQEIPFINIPPYFTEQHQFIFNSMDISDIDIKSKKLCMTTSLQFGNFFKLLRKGIHNNPNNLILLPYSLHPHVNQFGKILPQKIANIPLVRYANTNHFQTILHDNSSTILDNKNCTKPLIINTISSLIYSDYISGKITLNKLEDEQIPKLVSMTPGSALHVFEEINSSTLNLKEIINSFLTFPELNSSKIFWIKKLQCPGSDSPNKNNNIFKDIIILRNVFNSNALALCSQEELLPVENCAYFSTNTNREKKLTWEGSFVNDYNSKIIPCTDNLHKEECLNCFPQAQNILSHVLQSI